MSKIVDIQLDFLKNLSNKNSFDEFDINGSLFQIFLNSSFENKKYLQNNLEAQKNFQSLLIKNITLIQSNLLSYNKLLC
jgi:hypothetical protein